MKTVAVIGASNDRNKFGNKAFRGFLQKGYHAFPVNPNEPEVEGHASFKSVADIPNSLDLVTVYVPPPVLLKLLPGIAQKGCGELWLNPGTDSHSVLQEAKKLNLKTVQTCSILAIGLSPSQL
jgi:predicted CoA-binding protein